MDLVEQGKEIPRLSEIARGLRQTSVRQQIYGIAQILDRGKSPRLQTLNQLVKMMKLPPSVAEVKYPPPQRQPTISRPPKKVEIKKWWKKPVPGEEPLTKKE